jgi:hypothetical protein
LKFVSLFQKSDHYPEKTIGLRLSQKRYQSQGMANSRCRVEVGELLLCGKDCQFRKMNKRMKK